MSNVLDFHTLVATYSPVDTFSSIYKIIENDPKNRDLFFLCGKKRLGYHQAVVLPHSSFLSKLSENSMSGSRGEIIVTLDNIDPFIIKILMDCIYSGKCEKVPVEAFSEVEKVHQMLGLSIYFSAEVSNLKEVSMDLGEINPSVERGEFMCFECGMAFDMDVKLKTHMKKHLTDFEDKKKVREKREESIEINLNSFEESFTLELEDQHKNEVKYNETGSSEIKAISSSSNEKSQEDYNKMYPSLVDLVDLDKNETLAVKNYIDIDFQQSLEKKFSSKPQKSRETSLVSMSEKSGDPGIVCTICSSVSASVLKHFTSRSILLQHVSVSHFRKLLSEKYLNEFVAGQFCKYCPRIQKSSTAYLSHLGAYHEKVVKYLPTEMQMISSSRKRDLDRAFDRSSNSETKMIDFSKKNENANPETRLAIYKKSTNYESQTQGTVFGIHGYHPKTRGIKCTLCDGDRLFESKSLLLQHLSVKHYRRPITEMYLQNFEAGHPCDECEKPQKTTLAYLVHIGASHKKVLALITDEKLKQILIET